MHKVVEGKQLCVISIWSKPFRQRGRYIGYPFPVLQRHSQNLVDRSLVDPRIHVASIDLCLCGVVVAAGVLHLENEKGNLRGILATKRENCESFLDIQGALSKCNCD